MTGEKDRTTSRRVGASRRTLAWIDDPRFQGWGCAACAWLFNPLGPPTGESLDDMKHNYEQQREKDFAAHVCAEHPRAKDTQG